MTRSIIIGVLAFAVTTTLILAQSALFAAAVAS